MPSSGTLGTLRSISSQSYQLRSLVPRSLGYSPLRYEKVSKMKTLKLNSEERNLLEELERDEWVSTVSSPADLASFKKAAQNTVRKDKRVNIRISERDLTSIQKIALEEGIPYQTLISSVLHKFVNKKIEV